MSVQAMSWVIANSKHSLGNLVVLLMVANHARSDGTGAWPSIATLAKECRMSERGVRYCLRELEESGELRTEIGEGPHGTNMYSLPMVGGQILPQGGKAIAGEGGKAIAPDPSFNRPKENSYIYISTFEQFWQAYPRKVGKLKAERVWEKIPIGDHERVIKSIALWKQSYQWHQNDGLYIPYASTFLAQKRYQDEPWEGAFDEKANNHGSMFPADRKG